MADGDASRKAGFPRQAGTWLIDDPATHREPPVAGIRNAPGPSSHC